MQQTGNVEVQKKLRLNVLFALGWILVLAGTVGLFLPFVPGTLLILAGGVILSPQSAWLRRVLENCRACFPALKQPFGRFAAWVEVSRNRFRNSAGHSGSWWA